MEKPSSRLARLSSSISGSLEKFFYFWGSSIALHPWRSIGGCLFFVSLCCLGFLNFHREVRPERLWVPYGSRFYNTSIWLMSNFPPPVRQQFVLITADDVLTPLVMQQLLKIHTKVNHIETKRGTTWNDICFKFPVMKVGDGDENLLKNFRNRILMKREIESNYSNHDPNDDFFLDFESSFDLPVPTTVSTSTIRNAGKDRGAHQHSTHRHHHTMHNNQHGNHHMQSHNNQHGSHHMQNHNNQHGSHQMQNHNHLPSSATKPHHDKVDGIEFDDSFDSAFRGETFRSTANDSDISLSMPRELYCSSVEAVPKACWEYSLLELWNYDENIIANLTKADITRALNNMKASPVFGTPADYSILLGGEVFDEKGQVVKATAIMTIWHVEVNHSDVHVNNDLLDMGIADPASEDILEWESEFINKLLQNGNPFPGGNVLVRAWRSLADMSIESVKGGMGYAFFGYAVMGLYIIMMFSEFNIVEQRILTAFMGVVAVWLSFFATIGVCSAFGLFYGPLHPNIGIILLGLGVDDMFVITQCWHTLSTTDKTKALHERMGLTLKHAGVSITVTSLTNFSAFAVSALSCLPNIVSFAFHVAIGILIVYILQATFFVAFFVLDQKRIEAKRNPIFICYKHKEVKASKNSPRQMVQKVFDTIAPALTKVPFKIGILFSTAVILGFGCYGTYNLKQKFDPTWVMPTNSYLSKFVDTYLSHYTSHGDEGVFILTNINYTSEMKVIDNFVREIKEQNDIIDIVEDWYTDFKAFVNINFNEDVPNRPIPVPLFRSYLGRFLFSPSGAHHQKSFRFSEPLHCLSDAPPFETSLFPFRFRGFSGSHEHLPAMQRVKRIVDNVKFKEPGAWFSVWAYVFYLWENEEVILGETLRNVALASVCVFFSTLLALANFGGSIMVMLCVGMTLIDVLGFMHLWGVTINTITSIVLVLAIGISVDFAAHIGHAFLAAKGDRNTRASLAFRNIGPAVFNGGFSTLLAFSFLIEAGSYVLFIFFKLFLLVVIFGIFNGMLFLPVLLSIIGPPQYLHAHDTDISCEMKKFTTPLMNTNGKHNSTDEENQKENGVSSAKKVECENGSEEETNGLTKESHELC